jgi:hypothetical protein
MVTEPLVYPYRLAQWGFQSLTINPKNRASPLTAELGVPGVDKLLKAVQEMAVYIY